jgi:hypothetical protein
MSRLFVLTLIAALSGCGVETLETAAVAAKAKEQEALAAKQMQEKMQSQVEAAAQIDQSRLQEADRNAQ